ncbi:MAG TPA: response regulator transcription factor [Gaiellaceae bacterium]|nr:response regulator transcription factor [Gaiellaceae bacterium]
MTIISTEHPTLLVLDIHPVWLRAVAGIGQEAGFATTTTNSTSEAFKLLRGGGFDVVMCGVDAGGESLPWTELLSRSKRLAPSAKYILVADEEDQDVLQRAIGAGADAYITRRVEPEDLVFAIRQVIAPALYLIWPFSGSGRSAGKSAARPYGLTRRESEALELLTQGRSNAEIAKTLGITEQTVKGHLWRLYRKLGVTNRTAAARLIEKPGRGGEGGTARARGG